MRGRGYPTTPQPAIPSGALKTEVRTRLHNGKHSTDPTGQVNELQDTVKLVIRPIALRRPDIHYID